MRPHPGRSLLDERIELRSPHLNQRKLRRYEEAVQQHQKRREQQHEHGAS